MKAAKLLAPGHIEVVDEPMVQIAQSTEVLVRVKAVGICGTDLHIFHEGRADIDYPLIMGHELSGIVKEVGNSVHNLKAGDHVVLDPVISCGLCGSCKKGRFNVCKTVKCFGVHEQGAYCEYIVVDQSKLHKISHDFTFEEAAFVEPFSVAVNILSRAGIEEANDVVILGAGTIGLCLLQVAKSFNARVLITDIKNNKLMKAKELGADYIINSSEESLESAILRIFPDGENIIIDAVGTSALFETTMKLASPASTVVVIGFDSKEAKIIPASITRKELNIVGSRMNCGKFPDTIKLFESGKVNSKSMISAVYPLDRIQEAFEFSLKNSDKIVKTIIQI